MPLVAGSGREDLRRAWTEAWRKRRAGLPMEPLELQLAELIEQHPEYHDVLAAGEDALARDWTPETGRSNPFLHLGLHLAVRDAVATDRPPGIRAVQVRLLQGGLDVHGAEHVLLETLGETLWEAERSGRPPDGEAWLARATRRSTK